MINCRVSQVFESRKPFTTKREKSLYLCWLNQSFTQDNLKTLDGENLSIISPGRRNDVEGPDFLDAMILIGDKFLRGDVEIHIDSGDWFNHRHHEDPAYNNVVLHVVYSGTPGTNIVNQKGRSIPTLVLRPSGELVDDQPYLCTNWKGVNWEGARQVLNDFAAIRFQRKCLTVRSDLMMIDAEQYLYKGLCEVLGYSKNRESFKLLADLIAISTLYDILKDTDESERLITLESIYFGAAGFFKVKNYEDHLLNSIYLEELKKRWESLKSDYGLSNSIELEWHFSGSRPGNYPSRRLAALAQIIARAFPEPLSMLWISQMAVSRSLSAVLKWASDHFQKPFGMWMNHPLFGRSYGRKLIGNSRLMDLMSNLFFPFSQAIASINKDEGMLSKSSEFARGIGVGEIPASVIRLFSRLSIPVRNIDTNFLLQGSIEFLRRYCDLRLCKLCPLEKYAIL